MSVGTVVMFCVLLGMGVVLGGMIGSCFQVALRGDKRPIVSGALVGFTLALPAAFWAEDRHQSRSAWEARCEDELGGVVLEVTDGADADVCIKMESILEERP